MPRMIYAKKVYRHFKGKDYFVLDFAEHSETGERYVIYAALYGSNKIYIRPYTMFCSEVDRDKYPGATQKYRFELVTDSIPEGDEKKNDN